MLQKNEKATIQIITTNTTLEYRNKIASSDDFARSEIQAKVPELLLANKRKVAELVNEINVFNKALAGE